MLSTLYKPTSQKALFHKDVVSHVRKWLMGLQSSTDYKKVLLLNGPMACGKSATLDVLLKTYNKFEIDPVELRSNDKVTEFVNGLVDFKTPIMSSLIGSVSSHRFNIVIVQNIEACEKNIYSLIQLIHEKKGYNIPIILTCNNPKVKNDVVNSFPSSESVLSSSLTIIEFNKPSLLEINKLVNTVNDDHKLGLSKTDIKAIIDKSDFDLRQLFYILDAWGLKPSQSHFEEFLSGFDKKNADVDLQSKIHALFRFTNPPDPDYLSTSFLISLSEPITISSAIYQNYLSFVGQDTNTISEITDALSQANIVNAFIFEDQHWQLYEDFSVMGCVIPSYWIHNTATNIPINNTPPIVPFKDVSYNFANSFGEVKKTMIANHFDKRMGTSTSYASALLSMPTSDCFVLCKMLLSHMDIIKDFFDLNKKGKNTTKKEKCEIFKKAISQTGSTVHKSITALSDYVFTYKLFSIKGLDDLLLNVSKYSVVDEHCDAIDLRMVKRFLNIFTLDSQNKIFNSNVEYALKHQTFIHVLDICTQNQQAVIHRTVDNLVQDLDSIWNFA